MHHSTLRPFRHRLVIPTLLALVAAFGAASAQEAGLSDMTQLLNATTVTYYDEFPGDGDSAIFDSTAAEIPNDEAVLDTSYVELHYGGRSYLFAVTGVATGKEVRLEVGGDVNAATGATARPNLEEVIEWLDVAIDGGRDVLLTSRRQGDANVVTGIYDLEDADPSRPVVVEAGARVAILSEGRSTIHRVASSGDALGAVVLETEEGEAPLLSEEGEWYGVPRDAASEGGEEDGESEAAAGAGDPALGGGEDVEGTAQGAEGDPDEDDDGDTEEPAGATTAEEVATEGLEPGLGLPLDR